MLLPHDAEEFAFAWGLQGSKVKPVPGILVDELFHPDEAQEGAPRVVNVSSCASSPGIVLLVGSLMGLPVLHEQVIALLGKLQCYLVFAVPIDCLIDEVVCRPPDVASPVILILKCRVAPRNRWNDVLPPELLGTEKMLTHHTFCLFGGRDTGE